MPNTENINKLIDTLQADKENGTHFQMAGWSAYINPNEIAIEEYGQYHYCKTAMCLGGWAHLLHMQETNPELLKSKDWFGQMRRSEAVGAGWLDINSLDANNLFFIRDEFGYGVASIERFDNAPAEQRYAAAIRVLEILRDTGEVQWKQALRDAGLADILHDD